MKVKYIYSCKRATQLMSKGFERKLSLREEAALKAHLAICRTCVYGFRQFKALSRLYTKYTQAILKHPPPEEISLSLKAKKRIVSALCHQ